MADQESDLSPKDDAAVRRLLAQARVDSPTPPEVVHRMDGVLEGLSTQRVDPAHDLLVRRRRKNVSRLLLAAAAVLVVGIGINEVVGDSGPAVEATTALESDAGAVDDSQIVPNRSNATDPLGDLQAPPAAPAPAPEAASTELAQQTSETAPYAIRMGGGGLNKAVRRIMWVARGAAVDESGYLDLGEAKLGPGLTFSRDFACTPTDWGAGRLVPVLYKGTPKVLALRAPVGKTQVVDLLQCGTGEVIRSLTLPA